MTQIWSTLITILILKYLRALTKYNWYLSNLVTFLRLNLFVKIDLQKWLDEPFIKKGKHPNIEVQACFLIFNDFSGVLVTKSIHLTYSTIYLGQD